MTEGIYETLKLQQLNPAYLYHYSAKLALG